MIVLRCVPQLKEFERKRHTMNTVIIEKDSRMGRPSASGIFRLEQCPGSWFAESKCAPEEESDDASIGTYLHDCMECGRMPEDPEQAELVEFCHEAERGLVEDVFGGECSNLSVIREARMFAVDRDDSVVFSGKPDVVYYSPVKDVALVLDYKFGRLAVDAVEENRQLAALAVLLGDRLGHYPVVYAGVIQPYVSRRKPRLVKFLSQHLDAANVFLRKVIADAEVPDAPLRPDEKACRYCRAKASCPAVKLALVSVTSGDLSVVWEGWPPEKRREAYDLAQLAKRWAASVEAKVKADLKGGVEVPGLCLSSGKKAFTVTDPAAAFKVLNELFPDGIKAGEFTACCKVGITELDKLVHSVRKGQGVKTTVDESKRWLRKFLEGCASTKVSEGSVKEIGGGEA